MFTLHSKIKSCEVLVDFFRDSCLKMLFSRNLETLYFTKRYFRTITTFEIDFPYGLIFFHYFCFYPFISNWASLDHK